MKAMPTALLGVNAFSRCFRSVPNQSGLLRLPPPPIHREVSALKPNCALPYFTCSYTCIVGSCQDQSHCTFSLYIANALLISCTVQEQSARLTTCNLASAIELHAPRLVYASSPALSHDRPGHPECAARGTAILDALQAANLTAEAMPGQVRHPRRCIVTHCLCNMYTIAPHPTQSHNVMKLPLDTCA